MTLSRTNSNILTSNITLWIYFILLCNMFHQVPNIIRPTERVRALFKTRSNKYKWHFHGLLLSGSIHERTNRSFLPKDPLLWWMTWNFHLFNFKQFYFGWKTTLEAQSFVQNLPKENAGKSSITDILFEIPRPWLKILIMSFENLYIKCELMCILR